MNDNSATASFCPNQSPRRPLSQRMTTRRRRPPVQMSDNSVTRRSPCPDEWQICDATTPTRLQRVANRLTRTETQRPEFTIESLYGIPTAALSYQVRSFTRTISHKSGLPQHCDEVSRAASGLAAYLARFVRSQEPLVTRAVYRSIAMRYPALHLA